MSKFILVHDASNGSSPIIINTKCIVYVEKSELLKNEDLSYIKTVGCGGLAITSQFEERVKKFFDEHGIKTFLVYGWGCTESFTLGTIRSNYDKIRGAIIYKNREYHLSDKLEVNEDMIALLLPKVLFDLLKENELRVIKDNEEGDIVAFKINDELFFEYTLLDDNNHDTIYITMSYPSERDILDEELEAFKNSLNEYNSLFNKDIRIG